MSSFLDVYSFSTPEVILFSELSPFLCESYDVFVELVLRVFLSPSCLPEAMGFDRTIFLSYWQRFSFSGAMIEECLFFRATPLDVGEFYTSF